MKYGAPLATSVSKIISNKFEKEYKINKKTLHETQSKVCAKH